MSVIVNVFPDTQTPPRGAYTPGNQGLLGTVRLAGPVDMLLPTGDPAATVTYLREWAANMTALADEIEQAQP